jgi:hypothetical protein
MFIAMNRVLTIYLADVFFLRESIRLWVLDVSGN